MQEDLSRLTRELKKETCPQRVRDEVRGRISARESSRGWLRLAIPLVALVLVCGVSVWHWQAERDARQQAKLAERALHNRVQIQAERALDLIGSVLANAGADSGKVIYDRAVPPLRNSLQTANNKIIRHIEL